MGKGYGGYCVGVDDEEERMTMVVVEKKEGKKSFCQVAEI